MKGLIQKLKSIQTDEKFLVTMVAALAASVMAFSIIWLHTFGVIE